LITGEGLAKFYGVIAGLDPAIHQAKRLLAKRMDARVKPAHDGTV
jgi:hypothetical protein